MASHIIGPFSTYSRPLEDWQRDVLADAETWTFTTADRSHVSFHLAATPVVSFAPSATPVLSFTPRLEATNGD